MEGIVQHSTQHGSRIRMMRVRDVNKQQFVKKQQLNAMQDAPISSRSTLSDAKLCRVVNLLAVQEYHDVVQCWWTKHLSGGKGWSTQLGSENTNCHASTAKHVAYFTYFRLTVRPFAMTKPSDTP